MFHFSCNQCAFTLNIDYLPREYVLPDGRCVHMEQRHVWCDRCATITPAEALDEDVASKEAGATMLSLNHRELREKTFKHVWELELREKWIRESAERDSSREVWRALRKGPAACLKCRSAAISLPDASWADLVHGGCGGTMACSATLFGGTQLPIKPHQYTPEGELIGCGARAAGTSREEPLELWSIDPDASDAGKPPAGA
jgi:hypothetical protein